MRKINKSLLLTLFLSNHALANSYDDINFAEYLNKMGYKYFANHHLKELKSKTKSPIYQDHFDSLYILNLIHDIDDEYEFSRLEKLIEESKIKNSRLFNEVAESYEQRENFDKALELYNKITPATDEINLKKIYLNILKENFDEALELIKTVSDKFENEKTYYEGIILFNKKDFDKALEAFDFIKDNPKFENKVPCLIAQCYVEQKKYRTAINYIKKLEEDKIDFENKMDVYRIAGDASIFRKQYDEAIKFYDKALTTQTNETKTVEEEKQSVVVEQTPLAEPPARQSLNVVSLDDLDEIADIEADNSEEEDLEPEEKQNKNVKKIVDSKKSEVDVEKNDYEEEIDEEKEDSDEKPQQEPIFNIFDEIKVRQGFAYFKTKKYDEAKNLWQQVSYDDPKLFQLANYYSGITCLKQNQNEEALKYFEKSREALPNSVIQAEIVLCCAEINYNLKNFDISKELIKNFKKSFPDHKLSEKIDNLLFRISVNEKNYDFIIDELEKVEEKTEQQKELFQKALLFKGNDFLNRGKYEEAIELYEKSLDEGVSFKYNNHAYFGLGECFTYTKNFSRALEEYKNVDRSSEKYPYTILGISYIQFNSQRYDAAQKNFSEILRVYKNKFDKKTVADIQNRLGDCFFSKRQYQNALKQYQTNSDDHSLFYQGIIFNIWNNHTQALNSFKKINSASAYHEKALLEIGTIQLSRSQLSKAVETFSLFIERYPDSKFLGPVILKRATANASLKNLKKAQEDYLTYLETFPGDQNSSNVLSNLLDITKDETQRQEYINRFKGKIKNLSSLSFNDGKNYFYDQNYSKAIEILESFVAQNKNDKNFDEACFLLAESYRLTKNFDKSLSLYKSLANKEKSSFSIKSLIKTGAIYRSQGDHENAIKCFEKLKIKSKNSRDKSIALHGLMNENYLIENFEQAIGYANECLKLNSDNKNIFVDTNLIICKCNYGLKKFNQVLKSCQNFSKDKRFNEVQDELLFLKAESLYETKKYGESLNALFELTKKYQNSKWFDESYILMAKNYIAQNRITQANKTLDSIIKNSNDEKLKERAKSLMVKK